MEDSTTTPTATNNKRVRDDSEDLESDSPEAKRIRDNLLDILDDADTVLDRNPGNQDLASVIKSFEEEISLPPSQLPPEVEVAHSTESQPDLGYLLEASDDELGLPPTFSSSSGEEEKNEEDDILCVSSDAIGFDQIWGFDDDIPSYDSLGFGISSENNNNDEGNAGEFVALGGLFDYSDVFSGSSDFSDSSWRPESLPAL
ncbi:PREDICTED: uncharacterized protein LOC104601793 [Nelumbo nucifera]|uniref:Uncharacterized protein LOC104601793 n=2 Tax=Nelumbo nucifera TaxID=4432 RepID=A0A1U8ADJ5_NELNU|nr:PREDICTED: uncharacterized protein LOC104601793 [Nelumbo nucifera]DAD35332.1 TPA_asm: hypothetical protein HUJ06_005972 [Nelumbo nucifera]